MTDWAKHGFGPGTDVCARCKKTKETTRRNSKWCRACDRAMKGRAKTDGAMDRPDQGTIRRPVNVRKYRR